MSDTGFRQRLGALLRKEVQQLWRDKSNLTVGLLLPVVLILLFGYGLSFDVKRAPVALVLEDSSPLARQLVDGLLGTDYINSQGVASMQVAEQLLQRGTVDAVVRVPSDFSRAWAAGEGHVQLLLNGVDSTTAATIEAYVTAAIGLWSVKQQERSGKAVESARIELVSRTWFNEAGESRWFLVPGLLVLVLTLIGAFLTSLLIAREWERGTLEALFVTPVRPLELVLAKLLPYLAIGMVDLLFCIAAARGLFQVPIRGSLALLLFSSSLYLLVSLLIGLLISGLTRKQFEASQIALLVSFLPALMLSGFLFDIANVPLPVQLISQLLPATHFMVLAKTLFLVGNDWPTVLKNLLILSGYAMVLLLASTRTLKKTLD